MKKYLLLINIFCFGCDSPNSEKEEKFHPLIGDFLFQDLDSSPLCDAIELVTPGYKNANLSHIGIVVELGDPNCINPNYIFENDIQILEAIPKNVKITRLDSFLNRSFDRNNNPKVIVGRLKPKYRHTIDNAISFLISKLGAKYDDAFLLNNNEYYCSELIYEAFKKDKIS